MRLVILCEGDTEDKVLKDFLKPYCTGFQSVKIVNLRGAGRLKNEFRPVAALELEDPETLVFCLIDVLNSPFSFPQHIYDDPNPYHAQYSYMRQYMHQQIDESVRGRFYAFPIVMELETWLLADVDALNDYFSPPRAQHISPWSAPESILKPVDELKALMRRFGKGYYEKTIHGPLLFRRASAQRVYEDECPHFVEMINTLLKIQGLEGGKPTPQYEEPNRTLFHKLAALQREHDSIFEQVAESQHLSEEDWQSLDARLGAIEEEMGAIQNQIVALYRN